MSASPQIRGGMPLRPPLQPRETPLDLNGAEYAASSEMTSNSPNGKRLPSDSLTDSASENDPLSSLFAKRQKMKPGQDASPDMALDGRHFNPLRSDPKLENGFRTAKEESNPEFVRLSAGKGDPLPMDTNVLRDQERDSNDRRMSPHCTATLDYVSPHCTATLDYVTQLPEGCARDPSRPEVGLSRFQESDDDLEDDDNYLDSSEEEENDFDSCGLSGVEDESCGEDDQSVVSSVTVGSTSSLRSVASETMSSIFMNEKGVASNEDGSLLYNEAPSTGPLRSLSPSLFTHVPPSINFCKYHETTAKLPENISKLLKWRFTNITPLIVRKTITNSGFRTTKKTSLWCGTWGKHMKSPVFKGIKDFQKVNHFPGTFQIGRKDKLWKNFAKLQAKSGKEHFGFIPKTFVLPGDLKALKAAFEKEGVKKKWIVKPPASARGTGIQVVNKWSQMPLDTPMVVQRYITLPYLINNTKFDIRIYVLVTSFDPLRIYLYEDGLVRFASVKYQKDSKTLGDRFMHLTNYSVNKSSSSYTHNDDAGHCQGHKWTLKTLWGYLKAQEVDPGDLWNRIADLVIKTVLSGESEIVSRTRKCTRTLYNCFELFGFDVILDEKLRPWLLEVNISPSLHSASSLDHSVKGPLISDLLNLVGFHIPDKLSQEKQVELLKYLNLNETVSGLCLDRRIYTRLITPDEQAKHVKMNSLSRNHYLSQILENLLPDDIRHLIIAEDQLNRAGKFGCIFPTADTHNYFGFLEKVRYYNRLMDAWENKYSACRENGIQLLDSFCREKIHLKVTPRFKLPKFQVRYTLPGVWTIDQNPKYQKTLSPRAHINQVTNYEKCPSC